MWFAFDSHINKLNRLPFIRSYKRSLCQTEDCTKYNFTIVFDKYNFFICIKTG